MAQRIDERQQTILYHALGANFKQGLALFEERYAAAEADFQIEELESLLAVLGDSTLHDVHRPAWYSYYTARLAFQQWKPAQVELHLKEATCDESQELLPFQPDLLELLETRKALLEGKNRIIQGDWVRGIASLERARQKATAREETGILLEAEEARITAYIAWARACGDWQEPTRSPLARGLQRLLLITLLPLYPLLWIFLKARGLAILAGPAWRYGIYYSNWPIFWYYQQAYRLITRRASTEAQQAGTQVFHFQMRRADLLHRLLADRQAQQVYQSVLDQLPEKDDEIRRYRKAQIRHGLASIELQAGRHTAARALLSQARSAYAALADRNLWAQAVLLLGDIALKTGALSTALRNYSLAAQVLQQHQDLAGLTEALGRLYELGQAGIPEPLAQRLRQATDCIQPKTFTVRMPGRLFDVLQLVSWVLPVIVLLGWATVVSGLIIRAPVSNLNSLWQAIIGWQALLVLAGVWLGIGLVQALLGLFGLAFALRSGQMSLDYIIAGQDALEYRSLVKERSASLPWTEIDVHLRVERGLWGKPAGALSYEHLRGFEGNTIRLAGATAWYRQLQQTVQQKMGREPQSYRLNRIGIEFVLLNLFSALVFLAAFALAQRQLPLHNVPARAWLAAIFTLLYYVVILAVTARWVLHFTNVSYATAGKHATWLPWIATAIAAGLIGAGLLLKPALLMWSPMFVGWGVMLLATVLLRSAALARRPTGAVQRGLRLAVYLLGGLLVLRTVLPIAVNLYAFTYLGAASGFNPQQPSPPDPALRSTYFEQMRQAGVWMQRIDGTHPFAYGYLGYAAYWNEDYAQSLSFYDRGVRSFTPFRAPPDFNYCRALAYWKMEAEEQARQECELFNAAHAADTNCERLFPEVAGVCVDLP